VNDDERAGGIVEAFRLIHDVQAGLPGASEGLAELAVRAQKEGWDDLQRVCIFGEAVRLWMAGDPRAAEPVDLLIKKSVDAEDDILMALGLALRSDQGFADTDLVGTAAYDADLAKAVIALERGEGRPCERITAHTACAIALGNRWLFELSNEQYEKALAIGAAEPPGTVDFLLAPIRFNLAEQQVSWASKLFELGDEYGVRERWSAWNEVVSATAAYAMTQSWQIELEALGLVLRGLAGYDVSAEAMGVQARLGAEVGPAGRAFGLLRLAVAISAAMGGHGLDPRGAAADVEAATTAISPAIHPFMYDLSLFLAATLEARPGSDSGLRYARRVLEQQWTKRDASLRAMRAQIASARITSERDLLSRHARLDDLTGIANRRALEEFLSDLIHRGVERCGLVLFDVDSFKAVNDLYGHLAGDRLLVRIAQVLARGIRSSDLAVRLGGDEFAVMLAGVDPASAKSRAEALVQSFDDEPLGDIAEGLRLRVSAGVAIGAPAAIMDIWAAADAALYAAKAVGGHVVRVAPLLGDQTANTP
jgi:diguanylate cyclase (GGDEF)-like protein